jgi:hypothetical protein
LYWIVWDMHHIKIITVVNFALIQTSVSVGFFILHTAQILTIFLNSFLRFIADLLNFAQVYQREARKLNQKRDATDSVNKSIALVQYVYQFCSRLTNFTWHTDFSLKHVWTMLTIRRKTIHLWFFGMLARILSTLFVAWNLDSCVDNFMYIIRS